MAAPSTSTEVEAPSSTVEAPSSTVEASSKSSKQAEAASTQLVLFQARPELNSDVLELIFRHLEFKDLLAVELVCRRWKEVVGNRRLFKQLAKRICSKKVNVGFSRLAFTRQLRVLKRGRFGRRK